MLRIAEQDPRIALLNTVIQGFVNRVNVELPGMARTMPVSAFGKSDNRLDPLDFNGQLKDKASAEACTPRACIGKSPIRICSPRICASASATGEVKSLTGLRTMIIDNLSILDIGFEGEMTAVAEVEIEISMQELTGKVTGTAKAGLAGIAPSVSVHGRLGVRRPRIKSKLKLTVDLKALKITQIDRIFPFWL